MNCLLKFVVGFQCESLRWLEPYEGKLSRTILRGGDQNVNYYIPYPLTLHKDSVIIGIIVNDELYFKVDNQSAEIYKSRESKPFCYKARDKIISMSYWLVPLEIMEDELLLGSWLDGSYLVSLRTKNLKK